MKIRILAFTLLFSSCVFAQQITRVVSAANGTANIAPGSLATIYGQNLTARVESANGVPLPAQLAGVSVVLNVVGVFTPAPLVYASPAQITFVMPETVPPGMTTLRVMGEGGINVFTTISVARVAPALFSANGTGSGPAAATGKRLLIGSPLSGPVTVYTCDIPVVACHAIPLDVGIDTPVVLEFSGTGIRRGSNVTATIGGMPVAVWSVTPRPDYPGVDLVDVPLILGLRGAGLVDVVVTVDGTPSNAVQVAVE